MIFHSIKIGCCGFPTSRARYFENFEAVEIQQSFYQPPELHTAKKWREEAPANFEFTLKAWQLITHEPKSPTYKKLRIKIEPAKGKNFGSFKPTEEVLSAWEKTREIADALKARIIVFQCPASFVPSDKNKKNLQKFFSSIERGGYIFAWEPRGKWSKKEVEFLCRELDLVHVVDPFQVPTIYGKIFYYRLHGVGDYKYKYTHKDLIRLKELSKEEKGTYFMFNNVYMFEDAVAFKKMLEEE